MRKRAFGILIALSLAVLVLSSVAVAQGLLPAQVVPDTEPVAEIMVPRQAISHSRVIKERPLSSEVLQRCTIIHELNDAVALECPAGVQIAGAFEDKVYHTMDMEANVQINADKVWSQGYQGAGATVAILDTGINSDHPELVSSLVGGECFLKECTSFEDDNGHGTHVAGIITADGVGGETTDGNYLSKGVAPDAGVWMGKVCDSQGLCYASDIAAGIEYVVNHAQADTISISLGGGGTGGPNCNKDYLAKKVNWAVDNGLTVVAAAGNSPGVVTSPGCASGAIAVGAVDKSDVRAPFSGTGEALDIMAPGVSIYSTYLEGGYHFGSGTSMATPHVSATVALIKQKNPGWSDAEIKEALYNTAVDLGYREREQGHGRVDALGAVTYTGEAPPTPTPTPTPEPTTEPTPTPEECVQQGALCNCNGKCNPRESHGTCPWDCP